MNQLWQFGSKWEEEINAEIEENVSNNTKKTFGSNSQGCIHLLKIIAGITSGITDTISTSGNIHTYIIYQGTDILPEIFSSSPDTRVFVARKLHKGASPRVILSDKHECWTARKNFWRYISVPRYIRKRIAQKNFSLGKLYRKFSLGNISA
jgi:hypothetical protein